jgi:hypothetical protein
MENFLGEDSFDGGNVMSREIHVAFMISHRSGEWPLSEGIGLC